MTGGQMNLEQLEKLIDSGAYKQLARSQLETLEKKTDNQIKKIAYKSFVSYNVQDTRLVSGINNKLKFVSTALMVAFLSKSSPSEIFGTVKAWDNFTYNILLDKGKQPPPENYSSKSEKFAGAFVKDPRPGRSNWVLSFDLTSLYPSLIRMFGMSPETLVGGARSQPIPFMESLLSLSVSTEHLKEFNYSMAANGTTYRKDVEGILPFAMSYLMTERVKVKGDMNAKKRIIESLIKDGLIDKQTIKSKNDEIAMLSSKEQALKILANSGYGAVGNASFRYYRKEIAEGITLTGQLAIRFIANKINEFLNKKLNTTNQDFIVAVDTDSNYIVLDEWVNQQNIQHLPKNDIVDALDKFAKEELEPYITSQYDSLGKYLNADQNLLIMKRESIADCAIFRAKKNYIIQVYDNEGVRFAKPKLKMMGIETARTSTAMMTRDALKDSLNIVVNGTNVDLMDYVKLYKNQFMTSPLDKIASPRGVSDIDKWVADDQNVGFGDLFDYDDGGEFDMYAQVGQSGITRTPSNVKAAIAYNNMVNSSPQFKRKHELIKNGNKIKMMPLLPQNPIHSNIIGFIDVLPKEFGLEEFVDKETQWTKTYINPLKSFTDLIGWDIENKANLNSLFGDEDNMIEFVPKVVKKAKKKVSLSGLFD